MIKCCLRNFYLLMILTSAVWKISLQDPQKQSFKRSFTWLDVLFLWYVLFSWYIAAHLWANCQRNLKSFWKCFIASQSFKPRRLSSSIIIINEIKLTFAEIFKEFMRQRKVIFPSWKFISNVLKVLCTSSHPETIQSHRLIASRCYIRLDVVFHVDGLPKITIVCNFVQIPKPQVNSSKQLCKYRILVI